MDRWAPSLPHDVVWPVKKGAPERFVAQIAIRDLSPLIWGGCFRDTEFAQGSLAVFEHSVVYLEDEGALRDPPEGVPVLAEQDLVLADQLQACGAKNAFVAPRWFLTACDDASGVLCPVGETEAFRGLFGAATLRDIRFLPFDWVLARCLVDVLRMNLDRMLAGLSEEGIQDRSSDVPERRNATRELLADLNYLESQIEGRAPHHAFVPSDQKWLLEQLDPMTNKAWISSAATENGVEPRRLLDLPIFGPYFKLFEFRARQVYCEDPKSLPLETRRMLERCWSQQARSERVFAGNSRDDQPLPMADPLLLMTQTPVLVSSDVGRAGRRAWFIDEEGARAARFDDVTTVDIEVDGQKGTHLPNTVPLD